MESVLLTILLINALLLIAVVLMQRSEGGGLLSGGGGGGVMSGRAAANAMTRLTWILGTVFMACSLALFIVAAKSGADPSVMERANELAAPPAIGAGLPAAGDAPAAPPSVVGAPVDAPATPAPVADPAPEAPQAEAPATEAPAGETAPPAPAAGGN